MKKKKKYIDSYKKKSIVKWFWILITAPFSILIILLLLTAAGLFGKLPSFSELENPKSNLATEIYSEDRTMIGSFFLQNRSYVDYTELNDSLVAALVSTEDMRFYTHSGIDFISLARVGFKNIAMGDRGQGGGSTITQQLAKNLFPRDEDIYGKGIKKKVKLMIFKLKEWITAVKLEYNYTKEEIIAMYLNTVEYGSNAFGIKSAAQTFFNKTPAELTVTEAATLVGVVNAPSWYSPVRNKDRSQKRRNTVLSRMTETGFLTRAQYDSLSKLPIVLDYTPISHNVGTGTYFRGMLSSVMTMKRPSRNQFSNDWDYEQAVRQWDEDPLYGWCIKNKKADGTNYDIYRDGLKIYTTIDASMQRYAEEAVQECMENEIQPTMDKQISDTKTVFIGKSKDEIDKIVWQAMRYSDRYRALIRDGASAEEIEKAFNARTEMKVFTYKGEVDTVMTPRDSIIHHKTIMRASIMAMDPLTGHVKAYVGGPNYKYFKYDMVKQGKRQVGSTIKPFIYAFAISNLGLTPCTYVANYRVSIETESGVPWTPKEAVVTEGTYDGSLKPLKWGLANSRNNYSAWIMKQAKQPKAVADFIHRMGIKSYIEPVPALCLGTPDVSLYEMVASYGTFVNRGVYTEPIFVTRIEDRHGNIIASFTPSTSDAISEQTAYTMVGMMKGVVQNGTAGRLRWMYGFNSEMGGKTGTSQENKDAWFIGIAPKLVAGVWVGGEDQSVHFRRAADGARIALPIYASFFKKVYADPRLGVLESDTFPRGEGIVDDIDCNSVTYYNDSYNYYGTTTGEEEDDDSGFFD